MWLLDKITLAYIIGNEVKKWLDYCNVEISEDNIIDDEVIKELIEFYDNVDAFRDYKVWTKNAREIKSIIKWSQSILSWKDPKNFANEIYQIHAKVYKNLDTFYTRTTDVRIFKNLYY
jgi:hypothetical protein